MKINVHIFEVGQNVKIVNDVQGDWFTGSEGVVEDISRNKDGETIYGLRITKQGNNLLYEIKDVVYYFYAHELKSM